MKSPEDTPGAARDQEDLLARPFALAEHLSAPRFRVDTIAFADLGFICLLALFLSQAFLFSPGITVDLPTLASPTEAAGVHADAVATVWNNEIVTENGSYPVGRMDTAFRDLRENIGSRDRTLLLLANRSTSLETLTAIYASARSAGFEQVQIAAKPPPANSAAR